MNANYSLMGVVGVFIFTERTVQTHTKGREALNRKIYVAEKP